MSHFKSSFTTCNQSVNLNKEMDKTCANLYELHYRENFPNNIYRANIYLSIVIFIKQISDCKIILPTKSINKLLNLNKSVICSFIKIENLGFLLKSLIDKKNNSRNYSFIQNFINILFYLRIGCNNKNQQIFLQLNYRRI